MRNTTHNALKLKRDLQPKDYAEDTNIRMVDPHTGKVKKLPTWLFKIAREKGLI